MNKGTDVSGWLVVVVMVIIVISNFSTFRLGHKAELHIKQCEVELPRNKHCVITAVEGE